MTSIVGDIAVEVGADIAPLQRALGKGTQSLNAFGKDAGSAGVKFANMGKIVAAAGASIGVALIAMTKNAASAATEIENLSRISGISAEQFQKLAIAGNAVGVSQEKMADIIKDVNDKFGDFMATGAGPLADFFENIAPAVGVTADQFARLSGPDALQLYVKSLQDAGVSQQQMTFYMEALASDATALLPLLKNNGAALEQIGKDAEDAGRIISNDLVASGAELDRKLNEITDTIKQKAHQAILEYSDELMFMADWIEKRGIPWLVEFGRAFSNLVEQISPVVGMLQTLRDFQRDTGKTAIGGAVLEYFNPLLKLRNAYNGLFGDGGVFGGDTPDAGGGPGPLKIEVTPESNDIPLGKPTKTPPGKNSGGGVGGSGPSREDFESFMAGLASEAEALEIWRREELEKLAAFRAEGLGIKEEYDKAEEAIAKEHAEKLAAIEKAKNAERLSAVQGMFGDLASLMSTQNEKLFKIGKAAAIAEATVSGYKAAVDAWEKGMKIGGPPMAAAFSAASLVKTGALISSISSQSLSGGGSSGGGGGASAATAAAPQAPLDVRLSGTGNVVSWDSIGTLLDRLNDEAGDRGYTITRAT